jgi:YHS domain-containing protein
VCNQIDVCVTAGGSFPEEYSAVDAAKRALGDQCGIIISETLWGEKMQRAIRRSASVQRLPMQFSDVNGMRVSVLMLPNDAIVSHIDGTLRFEEDPSKGFPQAREEAPTAAAKSLARPATMSAASASSAGRKNATEWQQSQDEFEGLPPLPMNWIRIRSKSNGQIYFFNTKTNETTFDMPEMPLPPGWTKQVSKSTGKAYYFNARKNQSQFTRPTA